MRRTYSGVHVDRVGDEWTAGNGVSIWRREPGVWRISGLGLGRRVFAGSLAEACAKIAAVRAAEVRS